jgi:hypothetical protein
MTDVKRKEEITLEKSLKVIYGAMHMKAAGLCRHYGSNGLSFT